MRRRHLQPLLYLKGHHWVRVRHIRLHLPFTQGLHQHMAKAWGCPLGRLCPSIQHRRFQGQDRCTRPRRLISVAHPQQRTCLPRSRPITGPRLRPRLWFPRLPCSPQPLHRNRGTPHNRYDPTRRSLDMLLIHPAQNLLLQVLQLTEAQINTLPPPEREQIFKLVTVISFRYRLYPLTVRVQRQQYQGLKAP